MTSKVEWISVKEGIDNISINTDLLITDGYEVIFGFLSSNHEWCNNKDSLPLDGFDITHWAELPEPPECG